MPTDEEEISWQSFFGDVIVCQIEQFQHGKAAEAAWQGVDSIHSENLGIILKILQNFNEPQIQHAQLGQCGQ